MFNNSFGIQNKITKTKGKGKVSVCGKQILYKTYTFWCIGKIEKSVSTNKTTPSKQNFRHFGKPYKILHLENYIYCNKRAAGEKLSEGKQQQHNFPFILERKNISKKEKMRWIFHHLSRKKQKLIPFFPCIDQERESFFVPVFVCIFVDATFFRWLLHKAKCICTIRK